MEQANPLTAVHQVGLRPNGASTTAACWLQATQTWYRQQPGGEREFHFIIHNIGAIACSATVLLTQVDASLVWGSTGSVFAGSSLTFLWNNPQPDLVNEVSLSPKGATSTQPCECGVIERGFKRLPSGTEQAYFRIKNRGPITCAADIQIAFRARHTGFEPQKFSLAVGLGYWSAAELGYSLPSDNRLALSTGVEIQGTQTCDFRFGDAWYEQRISNGRVKQIFWFRLLLNNPDFICEKNSAFIAAATA